MGKKYHTLYDEDGEPFATFTLDEGRKAFLDSVVAQANVSRSEAEQVYTVLLAHLRQN